MLSSSLARYIVEGVQDDISSKTIRILRHAVDCDAIR